MISAIAKKSKSTKRSRAAIIFIGLSVLFGCLYANPNHSIDSIGEKTEHRIAEINEPVEFNALTTDPTLFQAEKLKKTIGAFDLVHRVPKRSICPKNLRSNAIGNGPIILSQDHRRQAFLCLDLPPPVQPISA